MNEILKSAVDDDCFFEFNLGNCISLIIINQKTTPQWFLPTITKFEADINCKVIVKKIPVEREVNYG